MEHDTDWMSLAGNGACVPMPKTTTEISDRFVGIYVGAPDFEALQKAAKYPLTLDMMFGVLRAAVARVESRCKGADARMAYLKSLDELTRAYHYYRVGEIRLGQLRIQLAHHLFRWGALPRSRQMADRYIEMLQQTLAEGESEIAH